MTSPLTFLTSLGQALAAMHLYTAGHPARDRSCRSGHDALRALLHDGQAVRFSFLDGDVVYGGRVLSEVKEWEWSRRLAAVGIERLEFIPPVGYDEFHEFLASVHEALAREGGGGLLEPRQAATGIRCGRIALAGEAIDRLVAQQVAARVPFSLAEEVEGIDWLHAEAGRSGRIPIVEAETIVRSLAIAMHQEGQVVLHLLALEDPGRYATTHCCNVAVLAMGLAEYLGYPPRDVRALGVAALLHDIGKTRISAEVVQKRGRFSPEDRAEMERHPVEGARLILSRHRHLDLAAVVAYEHHLWFDGGGYPRLTFPRDAHYASRIVQLCDVYDALVSWRPHRPPLSLEAAAGVLTGGSGTMFDPDLVQMMLGMLQQTRPRRLADGQATVEVSGTGPSSGGSEPWSR